MASLQCQGIWFHGVQTTSPHMNWCLSIIYQQRDDAYVTCPEKAHVSQVMEHWEKIKTKQLIGPGRREKWDDWQNRLQVLNMRLWSFLAEEKNRKHGKSLRSVRKECERGKVRENKWQKHWQRWRIDKEKKGKCLLGENTSVWTQSFQCAGRARGNNQAMVWDSEEIISFSFSTNSLWMELLKMNKKIFK